MRQLHKDLQNPGFSYFFDVSDPELEKNIGKFIRLKNSNKKFGTSGEYIHIIRNIQRIYDGRLAYRANILDPVHGENTFGRPILPEDIEEWVDSNEIEK